MFLSCLLRMNSKILAKGWATHTKSVLPKCALTVLYCKTQHYEKCFIARPNITINVLLQYCNIQHDDKCFIARQYIINIDLLQDTTYWTMLSCITRQIISASLLDTHLDISSPFQKGIFCRQINTNGSSWLSVLQYQSYTSCRTFWVRVELIGSLQ